MNLDGHKPVQQWKEHSDNQMKDIDGLLKTMKQEIIAIQQAVELYSPNDKEPYGASAEKLHLTLTEIQQEYDDQAGQFDDLSKNKPKSPDNFLGRILFGFGYENHRWRHYSQQVEDLFERTQGLRDMLNEAESLLEKLDNQPIEVSRQARKLHQQIEESLKIATKLRISGAHGDKLDRDEPRLKELETRLYTTPSYFFQASYNLVKQKSCKEDVIAAWSILKEIEKPSEHYLKEFQRWQAEYRTIAQRLAGIRTEINIIKTRLNEMSSSIGPLPEVEKLKQTFQRLQKEFSNLAIEHFADFDIDVTEVIDEVNSLAQKVEEIKEKLAEAQRKAHQADEELKALIEIRPGISWIKELLHQANNIWELLKNPESVSKVLDELKKVAGIYDQMMRRAEKQIREHMKGRVTA